MAGVSHKALLTPSQPEFWQQCQAAWGLQNKAAPQQQIPEWGEPQRGLTPGQPHTRGEDLPQADG